jgi:hypothetical protein
MLALPDEAIPPLPLEEGREAKTEQSMNISFEL